MSLAAGRRNKRIRIEARTVAEDDYGGEAEAWAVYARPWASVYYGSGAEQREAAQQGGSQAASFEVLSNSKTLHTVYSMRQELTALWQRSTASKEQLVHQLEDWCHRAEASGIAALREFSLRLRRYELAPA